MPRRSAILTVSLLTAIGSSALAQTTIQNDSITNFDDVAIQVGFVADERAAAWLTATCDGNLTAVQVLWLSFSGMHPDVLHQSVEIFEPGTFPNAGTRLVELLGPLMQDGGFNLFPIVPSIPVSTFQKLVVSFQFLEDPPLLGPSVVTDIDGCQANKNAIFVPPSTWFNACSLGVSGDFAIRGVLDCWVPIFDDGFESGDLTAWSSSVP